MGYLKDWMKQGKYVWYITGNMSTEQATEIVEHARSCLSLKPFPIEEITDVRAIALDAGSSFVYKVPLADEKNENSCTITYYEVGPVQDNLKLKLTNNIMMQYIDEPFFNDLRTKQQLGYVCSSRATSNYDVLGNTFTVQSPKKSCEYLVGAINKFLIDMRGQFQEMSDKEFETQRGAVITMIAEKDINIQ